MSALHTLYRINEENLGARRRYGRAQEGYLTRIFTLFAADRRSG